jgi:hypothetical protein
MGDTWKYVLGKTDVKPIPNDIFSVAPTGRGVIHHPPIITQLGIHI